MKKLILIFLLSSLPANAATYIGCGTPDPKTAYFTMDDKKTILHPCTSQNFMDGQFIYRLHVITNMNAPRNPDFNMGFNVVYTEGQTFAQAKIIADQYANRAEQPDMNAINERIEYLKQRLMSQKMSDNAEAVKKSADGQFVNPNQQPVKP